VSTRGSIDDKDRPRTRGPAGPRTADAGPGIVEQLRQAAVYVETAAVLERRACRADNPALAALLRERAAVRRRTAERLRRALTDQNVARPATRRAAGWG
jgi:hypothetical protein